MADLLLQIASNKSARRVVQTLGLPLPMPERLERAPGAWEERPLHGRTVVVGSGPAPALTKVLAGVLTAAGADPWVLGTEEQLQAWREAGEGWGRPPHEATVEGPWPPANGARTSDPVAVGGAAAGAPESDPGVRRRVAASGEGPLRPWALVLDASGVSTPQDLRALYDFFQPRIRDIARSGRVVVLGRPPETGRTARESAARHALEGFVRSVGREIGRKGATALLVTVDEGAEDHLEGALRFFLSPRSAYVTGQVVHVSGRVRLADPRRPTAARPLEGKVAVVTGAARGIGEAIATVMAREGARVVVVDRPEDDALGAEVARAVGGTFFGLDVAAPDAGTKLAEHLRKGFGRVDVLVNNAGITRDKTLANMKPEVWDLTIAVNLTAVAELTEALEPLMGPDARVVCLSSIAGIAGNVGQTNYSASKSGVIGFVEATAARLAAKGVAVNAIAPGFIETRLTDAIPVATREVARRLSNLGQGGLPVDVAEVALFLSSPGAAALSGQVVRVCGGNFVGA